MSKQHSWRKDGNISLDDKDKMAWAVCVYMRGERDDYECKNCPATENVGNDRKGTRACGVFAEDIINICQTGNPWRKTEEEMKNFQNRNADGDAQTSPS